VTPTPNTPAEARRVLDEQLATMLGGESLADWGWARLDALTLLVPLVGVRESGESDAFLLRLGFGYYPEWPPSALFVNPSTLRYSYPDDAPYLPLIQGTQELQVHQKYEVPGGSGQLICASVTLEFYVVSHSVNDEHIWNPERQNFAATINGIRQWLKPPYYNGRQRRP
jgi:hypothetical protein